MFPVCCSAFGRLEVRKPQRSLVAAASFALQKEARARQNDLSYSNRLKRNFLWIIVHTRILAAYNLLTNEKLPPVRHGS